VAWSPIGGGAPANDEWRRAQHFVNDFNQTVRSNFNASDHTVLDESMSPWTPRQSKTGNLPHLSYIMCKPKPLGAEFKSKACGKSGVFLFLEIQRGKEGMKDSKYQRELGATTACTIQMAEAMVSNEEDDRDTVFGDSWFKTSKEIVLRSSHFIGVVKTSHACHPKLFIEETTKDWPGGTHLVLQSQLGDKDQIAIGYKYFLF
jgi:hypothetical protein